MFWSRCWRLEVDGSFDDLEQQAAWAVILYQPSGETAARWIGNGPATSSFQSELLAIQNGIQHTKHYLQDGQQCILASDCLAAIEMLQLWPSSPQPTSTHAQLLSSISKDLDRFQLTWIPRRYNREADYLAGRAANLPTSQSGLLDSSVLGLGQQEELDHQRRQARAERRREHKLNYLIKLVQQSRAKHDTQSRLRQCN